MGGRTLQAISIFLLSWAATASEDVRNMLCAYLAAGVLLGLLAHTFFGLWWLDAAVALAIAALVVHGGAGGLGRRGLRLRAIPGLEGAGARDEECCA